MTRVALGCILALSTAPAMAADELPTLAVVGIHQAELDLEAQAAAVQELVVTIDETGKANAIADQEVASTISGRESVILEDGLLGAGRTLLSDGRNLYNQAAPEDAIPVLQSAIETLALGQAAANDVKDMWDAWIYLGTSHWSLGNENDTMAAFRSAAALNPARQPNPAQFPPDVIEAYQSAVRMLRADEAALVITTSDPNATIFVDGEQRGTGNVTIEGMLPGAHYVVARSGDLAAYQLVAIPLTRRLVPRESPPDGEGAEGGEPPPPPPPPERREVKVALTLGTPTLGVSGTSKAARARQTSALYKAFGEHASGVDYVLLAGVDDNELSLQLYAPRSDAFSKAVTTEFEGDATDEAVATLPLLLNLVDKQGVLPAENTSPLASALHVGANAEFAALLVNPRDPVAILPSDYKRSPVVPIILGSVAGVSLGTAGFFVVRQIVDPPEPIDAGTIIVGPF